MVRQADDPSYDLTEPGFLRSVGMLDTLPERVTLFCATAAAGPAQLLRDKYRCGVVLLPAGMLKHVDVWAVGYDNNYVWSPGA